jgi:para-nitrobenzyl esterase
MKFAVKLAVISLMAPFLQGHAQIVQTASGKVSGVKASGSTVTVFKGIPFAAPPVGDLRWRPPASPKPWPGIRKADAFGPSCIQQPAREMLPWTAEFLIANQVSEDCLYLNVWTPRPSTGPNLPVIVYIHGGAFTGGSGEVPIYDGEHLAARNTIIVTINYRLGALGFLAHPELTAESPHHSSGNYALLDQIAALQWVQTNIREFGGDPQKITIWGQSAGAFSVQDLIASPLAAGLFEHAMADSGIGLGGLHMANLKTSEEAGVKFAEEHHASSLKELRAIPAADLLATPQGALPRFSPIVDGWVLPATPLELSNRAADNDVPIVTGYQANDGLLFSPHIDSPADLSRLAHQQLGEMSSEFEKLYPAATAEEARKMLAESIRDRDRVSMYLWASRRSRNHHQPVFTYFFDRGIPWPQHPEFQAFHSGELPYFFMNTMMLDRPWEKVDETFSEITSGYLINFAAGGNPNGSGLPQWPRVSAVKPSTMEIGAITAPMSLATEARMDFWVRYFDSAEGKNAPPF